MECVTSYCLHGTAHNFLNIIPIAKKKSWTEAFKLMNLLKILGTSTGRGCEICKRKKCSRHAWPNNAFVLPCGMDISSIQDRLGLAFFSCCAGSDGHFI